jgi:nitroimidazol reductase NimA-like FMN-containing flavoprotein (pyridoxamine 5'-phosphate oxidase superfamily)
MARVRLSDDECWTALRLAHTGTVTTLRRDGWPISLPVWFTVIEEAVYFRTPARSKKVARIRRDERACFQVESGLAWRELAAVVMPARASLVEPDSQLAQRAEASLNEKYAEFTTQPSSMSEATREHYAGTFAVVRLDPSARFVSWDNAKLQIAA